MPRELLVSHNTGVAMYAVGRVQGNRNDQIGFWGNVTADALQGFAGANWANYAIPLVELGTTGLYQGDMPAVFNTEQAIEIIYLEQLAANPAMGDTKVSGSLMELLDNWWVATAALAI